MKKLLVIMFLLLLCGTVQAQTEANDVWYLVWPQIHAGASATGLTVVENAVNNPYEGVTVTITVVDSSATSDSSFYKLFSEPIYTKGAITATGEITVSVITDTSMDATSNRTGSAFTQYGDSVYINYALKTSDVAYADSSVFDIIAYGGLTAVSGTAALKPITITTATANVDTLFKKWTWFELTIVDTTRWGQRYSQYWRFGGPGGGESACVIAGTYAGGSNADYFYYIIYDSNGAEDEDSIIWGHYYYDGDSMRTPRDTALITASAQNLDSGMTINFTADDGQVHRDTFMFVAGDSLWYGKETKFNIRLGLNVRFPCGDK